MCGIEAAQCTVLCCSNLEGWRCLPSGISDEYSRRSQNSAYQTGPFTMSPILLDLPPISAPIYQPLNNFTSLGTCVFLDLPFVGAHSLARRLLLPQANSCFYSSGHLRFSSSAFLDSHIVRAHSGCCDFVFRGLQMPLDS